MNGCCGLVGPELELGREDGGVGTLIVALGAAAMRVGRAVATTIGCVGAARTGVLAGLSLHSLVNGLS